MIKFKRYPYRIGETYGKGELSKRQITLAINKPIRQAHKLKAKLPLLADLIVAEPNASFDPKAETARRQSYFDRCTSSMRQFECETWQKARKRFFELDATTQQAIIDRWNMLTKRHMPATSVRFAGVVDELSGDRAKRLEQCERDYQAYRQANGLDSQMSLF